MLFTINDDNSLLDNYFNISNDYNLNNSNNIQNPQEGLKLGNMFKNEYIPYQNYQPVNIKVNNEQEQDLLKIQELCFAIIDLNLLLDINPNNYEYYNLLKKYNYKLNELSKNYANKYEPLELNYDMGNKYSWYQNPWPWEGKNV